GRPGVRVGDGAQPDYDSRNHPSRFGGGRGAGSRRPLLFWGALKTIVYIDGFNFYYGCIKDTPYRSLDLLKFAQAMLPKNEVVPAG
ncbi:MAG: hypothetical protein WA208_11155, partial [Thermoanaerobaculia bacterium]